MKLYELTQGYNELMMMLETATEDDRVAIENTLEDLKDSIEEKAMNICGMIKNLEADITGIADEVKRLTARKKTTENQIEQLRGYLMNELTSTGLKKLDAGTFKVSLRKSESVEVPDPKALPEEYVTMTIDYKPIRKDIKAAIKAGLVVEGATIIEKESLMIR